MAARTAAPMPAVTTVGKRTAYTYAAEASDSRERLGLDALRGFLHGTDPAAVSELGLAPAVVITALFALATFAAASWAARGHTRGDLQ